MSLKTEIDKTNKLQNDIKLAKQNINAEIISGGGTVANNLKEVPEKIKSMIKNNYKKVAIIDGLKVISVPVNANSVTHKVNLNLNFTPSKIFLQFKGSWNQVQNYVISSEWHTQRYPLKAEYLKIYINTMSSSSFDLVMTSTESRSLAMNVEHIIAIE